jgi:hypothetical protein
MHPPNVTYTPEPTFEHPSYKWTEIPTTAHPPVRHSTSDQIIGTWKSVGLPYDITTIFVEGGAGHMTASAVWQSQQKDLSWSNNGTLDTYNTSYIISISDGSGSVAHGTSNGKIMYVDIFPDKGYMVKIL